MQSGHVLQFIFLMKAPEGIILVQLTPGLVFSAVSIWHELMKETRCLRTCHHKATVHAQDNLAAAHCPILGLDLITGRGATDGSQIEDQAKGSSRRADDHRLTCHEHVDM